VLLPEDGGQLPKHVEENTISYIQGVPG